MSEKIMKDWFITVPWGKLAMLSWGDPTLPPVLLIHGYVDTAATFIPLVSALPNTYYYVSFDLPGHGRSDTLTGPPFSYIHLVDAVRQVVEQLRWDTFYCIAHSMGYPISAAYNAVFPGRIRRLVSLAGTVAIQTHGLVEYYDKWSEISYDNYYSRYYTPPPPVSYTYEEAVRILAAARDVSEEAVAVLTTRCLEPFDGKLRFTWDVKAKKIFVAPFHEDIVYGILSVPTPTLCLVPTDDQSIVAFKEYHVKMLARLKSERYVLVDVPGGHNVHFTNPEHIVSHIVRFLNEDVKCKL